MKPVKKQTVVNFFQGNFLSNQRTFFLRIAVILNVQKFIPLVAKREKDKKCLKFT